MSSSFIIHEYVDISSFFKTPDLFDKRIGSYFSNLLITYLFHCEWADMEPYSSTTNDHILFVLDDLVQVLVRL